MSKRSSYSTFYNPPVRPPARIFSFFFSFSPSLSLNSLIILVVVTHVTTPISLSPIAASLQPRRAEYSPVQSSTIQYSWVVYKFKHTTKCSSQYVNSIITFIALFENLHCTVTQDFHEWVPHVTTMSELCHLPYYQQTASSSLTALDGHAGHNPPEEHDWNLAFFSLMVSLIPQLVQDQVVSVGTLR